MVADLRGDGLRLILHAAPGGRLSFPTLPDAAFSGAVIAFPGGRRGIIANSEALCRHPLRTEATFSAHSGRRAILRPALKLVAC